MLKLFELLSILDYFTPAKGLVEDVINDPTLFQDNTWTYFVPYGEANGSGWSARQIEDLMAKHGIKTWGSQITGGDFFFSVPLDQAGWAEYVLLRYGVPLQEHSMDPPRPKPVTEMSSGVDFAPIGVVHIGPSLPGRLLRWLFK